MHMQKGPNLIEVQCTCPYRSLVYKCYNGENGDRIFFLKKNQTKQQQQKRIKTEKYFSL